MLSRPMRFAPYGQVQYDIDTALLETAVRAAGYFFGLRGGRFTGFRLTPISLAWS